ncbi:MAG: hypothetical protein AB7K24_18080 [Gemmataceae bacterium]
MSTETPWEKSAAEEGVTESERALTRLARKAFLSLWSYPNVFTDEGRVTGKGDGKELCDLLVVFGNDVLLFSDKHCHYNSDTPVEVAWPRWYKRAIEKSVRQLTGAEKFARAFPNRIYTDRQCQAKLPIALPGPDAARFFLIAVTRGAHDAARIHFGSGSSGSFILRSDIRGKQHYENPFHVGFPLDNGRFIHVLDEATVDLLLEELDTVADLVEYLECKEAFFSNPNAIVAIPGEEELLAEYMTTLRGGRHALPEVPPDFDFFAFPEGSWNDYARSHQREAKREADKVSYAWDRVIEHHSGFIRAGTALSFTLPEPSGGDHERVVRAMASLNRLVRRKCAADLLYVLSQDPEGGVFARMSMLGTPPDRCFVFLAVKRQSDISYDEYRESRRMYLTTYCNAIREQMPSLKEAIGIAAEPFSDGESSFEFIYVDHSSPMSVEEQRMWREMADELGIVRPTAPEKFNRGTTFEFPIAFGREPTQKQPNLNRAERRKLQALARRKRRP